MSRPAPLLLAGLFLLGALPSSAEPEQTAAGSGHTGAPTSGTGRTRTRPRRTSRQAPPSAAATSASTAPTATDAPPATSSLPPMPPPPVQATTSSRAEPTLAAPEAVSDAVPETPAPSASARASSQRPRLAVLALDAAGGVEPGVATTLTEAMTAEIAARGMFDVISAKDVETLLGLERQKQMLGCAEETSCIAELAGALGARFVLSGSVAKLGDTYQLNLQTLDTSRATPVGRATRLFSDLGTLRAQLAYAVAEATGTPLPPPPSRVLPFSLMGAGALSVVGGSVVGLLALNAESGIERELRNGQTQPAALKPMSAYQEELNAVAVQRTFSLVALGAGAGLLLTGYLLNPADPLEGARGSKVALVPTAGPGAQGVALVGVWP